MDYDYESIILEEVALEGLDGITLSALWSRLSDRLKSTMSIDSHVKNYFWNLCIDQVEFCFFELPEPRQPLILFDRYAKGNDEESDFIEDSSPEIYPFCNVEDPDVWGSCATFYTRINITKEVRSKTSSKLTLSDVEARWGEKLVIVASYEARRKALLGEQCDPLWHLKKIQYITLERIGRSRYYGELTNGSKSLSQFHTCAKKMFYYRIILLNRGIITKQIHYHKPKDSTQRTVSLLHLKRFYVEHKSRLYLTIEETCKHLLSKPGRMDILLSIRTKLNIKKKENFLKCIKKIADIRMMSLNEFKAATGDDQDFSNRLVKVAILYDNVNLENLDKILEGTESKELEEENDDQLEDEVEEISMKKTTIPNTALFPKLSVPDTSNQVIDRPLLSQVYAKFNQIGSEGATMQQMAQLMGLTRLESRLICKYLKDKLGLLTTLKRDVGKQRESAYISKHFFKSNRQSIFEECAKIKDFAASSKTESSVKEEKEIENELDVSISSGDVKDEKVKRKPQHSTLLQNIDVVMDKNSKADNPVTLKKLKRINTILQTVRKAKILDNHIPLYNLILNNESKEGGGRMDHKSFHRIIRDLSKEKHLRIIECTISVGNKDKKIQFICDMSVQPDDPMVISAQEQAKLKFLTSAGVSFAENKNTSFHESIAQLRKLNNKVDDRPKVYSLSLGRSYGYEPKLIRCQLFHKFLFYLNFGYEGQENLEIPDHIMDIETASLPKIYCYETEPSWKMFIYPLPIHYGYNKGWCLMSDVLLRMPLSLLVRLVCFNYQIYGIEEYLNDPVKKHLPICFLPEALQKQLLHSRKYIFSAYECAQRLYYMGLLSLSPIEHKSKDMVFLYLHKNASVLDTSISRPNYYKTSEDINYPSRKYNFEDVLSVQAYWNDLETVCRNTPLSPLHVSADEPLTISVEVMEKKIAIIPLIPSEENEKAIDTGIAPGDQRGAGGLDSAFFSHLNRSWNWNQPKAKVYYKSSKKSDKSKQKKPSALVCVQLRNNANVPFNIKNRMARLVINEQLKGPNEEVIISKTKRPSRRSMIRHVKARVPKKRKSSKYDEIDKMVLAKAKRKRVNWTVKEDSLLLLGKVAYVLMFDKPRNSLSCRWIRDFLHEQNEVSKNKTAAACQRRINYMLKNLQTGYHISVYVGEARQDEKIVEQIQDLSTLSPLNDKEIFKKRFDAIMDILMSKFQSDPNRSSSTAVQLPNTLSELRENYQITFAKDYWGKSGNYVDVKSKECILFHLASTLILSAVAGFTSDEKHLPQQLYEVFKRFPDDLLLNAFNLIKSSGVICCKKIKVRRKSLKNSPVFGTLTYRLSYRYKNMLRSKYPESCFAEMSDMANHLKNNAKEIGAQPLPIEIDKEGGYALIIISLAATRKIKFDFEIPDEVVSLSDNIKGTKLSSIASDEEPPKKSLRIECEEPSNKNPNVECEEPPKKKPRIDCEESPEKKPRIECEESLKNKQSIECEKPPKKKPRIECEKLPKENLRLEDEEKGISNKEEVVEVESAQSKVAFKMTSKSSRLALYMLRQDMEDINTKAVQHSQDYLLIKPCIISCKLDIDAKIISPPLSVKSMSKLQEYLPSEKIFVSDIVAHYKALKKSGEEIAVMKKIYDMILNHGELGIRRVDLKTWFYQRFSFGDRSTQILLAHLKCMEESIGILAVGTSNRRYVAHIHSTDWQLRSYQFENETNESTSTFDFNKDKKIVHFLPKVWRRPDGTLNIPVYKELIVAVMGRIMNFPGINRDKLYTHFSNMLNLMELQETLNTLLELKSIKKMEVNRTSKSTLFSARPKYEIKVNSEEWSDAVSFEAEVEGPQRFAAYLLTI